MNLSSPTNSGEEAEILIARSVPEMPEITVKLEDLAASSFIRDERFRVTAR